MAVICLSGVPATHGLNYRVQGQVFCKDEPMAGATITLSGGNPLSISNITDASGTYIIDVPSSQWAETRRDCPCAQHK